ncbi:dTMP kinase [Candidatus Phytoplasma solani]|uniref:Thymidylate kinase n=1 Tax=Candidatus Phytoplasma solani TaxID=69896 RepID=A0A421NY74_9MOLU|nr:dTMP kinase [Candidatus Phytoplasma solani]RMI88965.1 thymidylate kinase [Candidatus Phytoplasma solani]CCP88178.1 Thymidylate kinase [Candidatus Phytoplasma solani]CCP88680.1 Thymidylate kinase [Candidatus Phytoplasma solani]
MFITFEGGEAAGKTTLARILAKKLKKDNYEVLLTKQPGGYPSFSFIRQTLLNPEMPAISLQTEALLYAADRIEHLNHIILPALQNKNIVICDRYVDSSFVYQGYARQLGKDYIAQINDFALKHPPNITFYLDLDPEIAKRRLAFFRSGTQNRLDLEKVQFHQKIREGYLQLAKQEPNRIITINADDSLAKISFVIYRKVKALLCRLNHC